MAFNFIRSRNPANPGHIRSEEPTNVIGKILAHVRAAATATAAPMSVMLVPAGMELQGFQREPAANFLVSLRWPLVQDGPGLMQRKRSLASSKTRLSLSRSRSPPWSPTRRPTSRLAFTIRCSVRFLVPLAL